VSHSALCHDGTRTSRDASLIDATPAPTVSRPPASSARHPRPISKSGPAGRRHPRQHDARRIPRATGPW
jgi:hypothetical protein